MHNPYSNKSHVNLSSYIKLPGSKYEVGEQNYNIQLPCFVQTTMARREAGETSSGISEDPELKARIKSVLDAKRNVKPPQTPKIQKVISVLRGHKDFQKHY